MSNPTRFKRRPRRLRPPAAPTALATVASVVIAVVIAACGTGSPSDPSASGTSGSHSSQTGLQQQALNFARCMRSHGVSNFPDPAAGGGVNLAGVNASSPAFEAARTACKRLEPVKRVSSEPPTAQAYARLLHWTSCMRVHGIAGLPDPRPDPPPSQSNVYGSLMGDGGYWVGIPISVNAHSPAFEHLATVCGESPGGHHA